MPSRPFEYVRLILALISITAIPSGIANRAASQDESVTLAARGEPTLPRVGAIAPATLTPDRLGDATMAQLWNRSVELETGRDFLGAAAVRERLVEHLPDSVHLHWRIARDYMQAIDTRPEEDREGRLELVMRSRDWARRARGLDPTCGECCLYDFAATARLAGLSGPMGALRHVGEAGRTLEHCLEHPPTWSDATWSHERANLYHGAGVFFRMVPESRWLSFLSGARGDKARAIELGRRAVAMAPDRVDYAVGLGAALLCHGANEGDEAEVREGRYLLLSVDAMPDYLSTDGLDRRRAATLRLDPDRACDDTRDGAIALD